MTWPECSYKQQYNFTPGGFIFEYLRFHNLYYRGTGIFCHRATFSMYLTVGSICQVLQTKLRKSCFSTAVGLDTFLLRSVSAGLGAPEDEISPLYKMLSVATDQTAILYRLLQINSLDS